MTNWLEAGDFIAALKALRHPKSQGEGFGESGGPTSRKGGETLRLRSGQAMGHPVTAF